VIRAVIKASANNSSVNVLSAPHILTSDNEEAEILVGDNIRSSRAACSREHHRDRRQHR
jgi:type II secretory pathway component GspD/PulD (secretin)